MIGRCTGKFQVEALPMHPAMEDYTPVDEDFQGRLLHQAALWDNAELLEDLLRGELAEFIDSQDSWGRTALHAAAITESSRCLEVLLRAGANPNLSCGPRGQQRVPLHVCAEHGHAYNIEKLLEYKANLGLADGAGITALDLSEKNENSKCCDILKAAAERLVRSPFETPYHLSRLIRNEKYPRANDSDLTPSFSYPKRIPPLIAR
jgi:ankyrin repeat protein